jgi:hypothetical protein
MTSGIFNVILKAKRKNSSWWGEVQNESDDNGGRSGFPSHAADSGSPKTDDTDGQQAFDGSIVNLLKEHQFDDVIANLHYHAETISDYFGNGEAYGLSLQYSLEEE